MNSTSALNLNFNINFNIKGYKVVWEHFGKSYHTGVYELRAESVKEAVSKFYKHHGQYSEEEGIGFNIVRVELSDTELKKEKLRRRYNELKRKER